MAKSRRRTENVSTRSDPSPSATATASGGADMQNPDRIAARAYEIYLARGGADGRDFDDWLAAERELAASPAREDAGE